METISTRYRPSVHGFRFGNQFRHQIVGELETHGRCNGMAHVSLDYYYSGRATPTIALVDYGERPHSGVAATSWAGGRVDLLARCGDRVITRVYRNGGWTSWENTGKRYLTETPACTSWGPDRLDLLYRDPQQRVLHRWWSGSDGALRTPRVARVSNEWAIDLHGLTDATPAIATPAPGRLEAWVRGTDGALWFTWGDQRPDGEMAWQPWASLGRPDGVTLTSGPAAASRLGWMNAVVRGSDGAYWHREWNQGWMPWRSVGGNWTSAPALTTSIPGRLELCGRDADGRLCFVAYGGARWIDWTPLGAPPPGLTEDVPAIIGSPGYLGLFARAPDESVWHIRWMGGWSSWEATEPWITPESRRLTDAIYERMMTSTHNKLIGLGVATVATAGLAAAFSTTVGPAINYLFWRPRSDEECWQWSFRDELARIAESLKAGRPLPVGLLDAEGGWGHEVVAHEITLWCDAAAGRPGTGDGQHIYVRIYDPNYPTDDQVWLHYDQLARTITSTTGERWRGAFARTDYSPAPTPL